MDIRRTIGSRILILRLKITYIFFLYHYLLIKVVVATAGINSFFFSKLELYHYFEKKTVHIKKQNKTTVFNYNSKISRHDQQNSFIINYFFIITMNKV